MIAYIIFIINSASTLPGRLPEYVGTTYFEMSPKYLERYIEMLFKPKSTQTYLK
jgi:hypothetical protein